MFHLWPSVQFEIQKFISFSQKWQSKDRMYVLYLVQNVKKDRLSRKLLIYLLMGGFWETINFVQFKLFSISLQQDEAVKVPPMYDCKEHTFGHSLKIESVWGDRTCL